LLLPADVEHIQRTYAAAGQAVEKIIALARHWSPDVVIAQVAFDVLGKPLGCNLPGKGHVLSR
jgi:hypothetical protein